MEAPEPPPEEDTQSCTVSRRSNPHWPVSENAGSATPALLATVTRDTNTVDDISDDEDQKPSTKTSDELEDDLAPADDLDAVHREAIERYEAGWEKDRENQAARSEDLRFLSEEEAIVGTRRAARALHHQPPYPHRHQVRAVRAPGHRRYPPAAPAITLFRLTSTPATRVRGRGVTRNGALHRAPQRRQGRLFQCRRPDGGGRHRSRPHLYRICRRHYVQPGLVSA